MKESLLIEGLKRQDRKVFDFIFNYYYSGLCSYSLQFLNDISATEDLVQDFFVALWLNSKNLDIKISLRSYLFSSIKNRCLDSLKHRKVVETYRNYKLFTSKNLEYTTDCYIAESELRQVIESAMEKLPPKSREIFEMSRLRGLSNLDISEKLGISKRTVEIQISNALKLLRLELSEYLPIFLILSIL